MAVIKAENIGSMDSISKLQEQKRFWSMTKPQVKRAQYIILCLLAVSFTFSSVSSLRPFECLSHARSIKSYESDVDRVLRLAPLTDGHNDLPIWLRAFYGNHINSLNESSSITGQVDIPRLRAGRVGAQFWSGYVPCPAEDTEDFPSSLYYQNIHDSLQQIDLIHRLIQAFPDDMRLARRATDVEEIFNSPKHRIASLIGLEGLHQIGNSASAMRMYYELGVRYISLTHDCNNVYADAALATRPKHNGLSRAGRELVFEMNRIGMIVDLSHSSRSTMADAINHSRAPVLFSHSNVFKLCEHPRNVPDDVLDGLKRNGGVIMVSFYPEYLNCADPASSSIHDVADHIMYVGDLIGFSHVGIGADFDGMQKGAIGLEDVSKYPALLQELLDRGLGVKELAGIAGLNVLRVLRDVEKISRTMHQILPLEDTVRPFFGNSSRSLN